MLANLTPKDLWECYNALPASSPVREKLRKDLAFETSMGIWRLIGNPTGTLDGEPVYADNSGFMSSGYTLFKRDHRPIPNDAYSRVEWDPDTPEQIYYKALARGLRRIHKT